jgi:flagellar biosynthesis/type III secretory pathway protein FliH
MMINYCTREDILADFLRYHGSEVTNMLTAYSREEELEERRLEAEEIREAAMRSGLAEGLAKGRLEGMAKGRLEGMAKGRLEGMAQGKLVGKAEIMELLRKGYTLADLERMEKRR